MQPFDIIYQRAAERKGGQQALASLLTGVSPKSASELNEIPDDRWLSTMSRCIFRAGVVWRVVDNKWPAFEQAFRQFDLLHVAYLSDEAIDEMNRNANLIRHYKKLVTVRNNASFLLEAVEQHGSVGQYFSSWGSAAYVELLIDLKKRANSLGGTSAQYFLRYMGLDSFILSGAVVKALQIAGVLTQAPASQRQLRHIQSVFDTWSEQSGLCLSHVSRVLAMSVDS